MIYLDTSALIKRYIWEAGSEQVRQVFGDNHHFEDCLLRSLRSFDSPHARRPSHPGPVRSGLPAL